MRRILLVATRDVAGFFGSDWGPAVLAATLLAEAGWFFGWALPSGAAYSADVLERFFALHGVVSLGLAALLSVRSLADERVQGTWTLLRGAPLSDRELTLGKYAGVMVTLAGQALLTGHFPALLMVHGDLGLGHLVVGYCGALGLASVGAAVSLWASSITERQVLALSVASIVLVPLAGASFISRVVDPPFRSIVAYASVLDRHQRAWSEGQANTETVVLFGTLTFVFLLMATQSLCARRWA